MNSPIRHGNEEHYKQDLKTLQDKFSQVIEAGVRQIAILADDANHGGDNYIKLLTDMTTWLKAKKKKFLDLKVTLPFCVQEYMGMGKPYFSQFPDNVQIIMTEARFWARSAIILLTPLSTLLSVVLICGLIGLVVTILKNHLIIELSADFCIPMSVLTIFKVSF